MTRGHGSLGTVGVPGRPGAPPRLRHGYVERAAVQYRISAASGALLTTFTGLPAPLCQALAACGTSGSISQTLGAAGTITFTAQRTIAHPLSAGAIRADLSAGRLHPLFLTSHARLELHVAATVAMADGSACRDTSDIPLAMEDSFPGPGRTLMAQLSPTSGFGPLGPTSADLGRSSSSAPPASPGRSRSSRSQSPSPVGSSSGSRARRPPAAHGSSAAVTLASAPPGASTCADASSTGSALSLTVRTGRVILDLSRASPDLLSSRCAGPRGADILPRLRAPAISLRTLRAGHTSVSLGASESFASPGFADVVRSTLAIHLGRPGRVTPTTGPRRTVRRYRELLLSYRARLTGTLTESATADGILGLCGPLGACGLTGVTTVTPVVRAAHGTVQVIAAAARPERDLLATVGLSAAGDPNGVRVFGSVGWPSGGSTRTVTRQGTVTCSDVDQLGGGGITLLAGRRRAVVVYTPQSFVVGGPLSRCPGPEPSSITLGAAAGVITTAQLAQATITVPIDRSGLRSSDYGYRVGVVSRLSVTLTRTGLRTVTFSAPGSLS